MNLHKQESIGNIKYLWAYDLYNEQNACYWHKGEVNTSQDILDWAKLSDHEKEFYTYIFRYFTQADINVGGGYRDYLIPYYKNNEISSMHALFYNIEQTHIWSYRGLVIDTGMKEVEFDKFLEFEEMKKKNEILNVCKMDTTENRIYTLTTLLATEGIQLFSSFAMLLHAQYRNVLNGMCKIVAYSLRDENLHVMGHIQTIAEEKRLGIENGELGGDDIARINNNMTKIIKDMVELEDIFIDNAFQDFVIEGITKKEIKAYIRYIASERLFNLNLKPIYNDAEAYMPDWLHKTLYGFGVTNFFHNREIEYKKRNVNPVNFKLDIEV